MRRRICIEISGIGTLYPAKVSDNAYLTRHKADARLYHNTLNADIAVREWTGTLILLDFSGFDVWHEDATA